MLILELLSQLESMESFYGKLDTNSQLCTVLKKSKETVLEFYKGTITVL